MALPFSYNLRNLLVRKLSSALTVVVVAAVVFVLAVLLSFAGGIRASLEATGMKRNLVVLAPGSTSESTSILFPDEVTRLVQTPGVDRDAGGTLLVSYEVSVQTSISRLGPQGNLANVAVRGVDDVAFLIHDNVKVVEGTRFEQGSQQVIVGKQAANRYVGLEIGKTLPLGRLADRHFTVVGIFEAGGSALESEIWGPRTMLSDAYNRSFLSSALVRIEKEGDVQNAEDYINGAAVNLSARTEIDYYVELASKTREIVFLATVLITIMGIGAIFAVANTMYAAVDARKREIAMIRTLGFGRSAIVLSFTAESLLLCVPACAIGLAASSLLHGARQDYLSDATWTVLAYELRITPRIVAVCLALAISVAVAGAVAPALKASRLNLIQALRKA